MVAYYGIILTRAVFGWAPHAFEPQYHKRGFEILSKQQDVHLWHNNRLCPRKHGADQNLFLKGHLEPPRYGNISKKCTKLCYTTSRRMDVPLLKAEQIARGNITSQVKVGSKRRWRNAAHTVGAVSRRRRRRRSGWTRSRSLLHSCCNISCSRNSKCKEVKCN